jgi:hypoxanthine phosphoribosyltransferase
VRLQRFLTRCKQRQCAFWETPAELEASVTRSLAKLIQQQEGRVLGRDHGFTSDVVPGRTSIIAERVHLAFDATNSIYLNRVKMPDDGVQTLLSWAEFGYGIEALMRQIRGGRIRLTADVVIGINETGLSIASFLSAALMHYCPIGFLRTARTDELHEVWLPQSPRAGTILIVDSEIKTGSTLTRAVEIVRAKLSPRQLVAACLAVQSTPDCAGKRITLDELTASKALRSLNLDGFCAAFIAPPPSIDPPLYLD